MNDTTTIHGVLVFHSETGTEGGYYAFQDEKFMGLSAPDQWSCSRCGRVWDRDELKEPPPPSFTYWRQYNCRPAPAEPEMVWGGFGYDEPHDDLPESAPGGPTDSWIKRSNALSRKCWEHGHAEWTQMYPNGIWSYEGLKMLKNGDHLKIWSPDKTEVVWEGQVKLRQVDSFGPEGGTLGWRVHQKEDVGVGEETWFRWFADSLPAELTRD